MPAMAINEKEVVVEEMLFNKAEMLNRRASHPKFKAREIIRALEIKKGSVVAYIGAGGGYFTMLFAEAVGREGRVYAVDTDVKLLNYIEKRAVERKVDGDAPALLRLSV